MTEGSQGRMQVYCIDLASLAGPVPVGAHDQCRFWSWSWSGWKCPTCLRSWHSAYTVAFRIHQTRTTKTSKEFGDSTSELFSPCWSFGAKSQRLGFWFPSCKFACRLWICLLLLAQQQFHLEFARGFANCNWSGTWTEYGDTPES